MRKYRRILGHLRVEGIAFRPMVWSQEGRPHPATMRILAYASQLAARKKVGIVAKSFKTRWHRESTGELQRGKARAILACHPMRNNRARFLLTGRVGAGVSGCPSGGDLSFGLNVD